MSRLDINIRRLEAQRACLGLAARLIHDLPGPVFELGLGNGRTYDHLREVCPGREIFVFEREVAAHPDCVPGEAHLLLGDFRDTLPQAAQRFRHKVAFIHAEFGTANPECDRKLAAFIAEQLPLLLAPGGLIAADRDVAFQWSATVALPDRFDDGAYFLYRAGPAVAQAQPALGATAPDPALGAAD